MTTGQVKSNQTGSYKNFFLLQSIGLKGEKLERTNKL